MLDGPTVGRKLGKYLIEAELGRGGMGVVYRARHVMLARTVAIKVVSSTLSADADGLRRFKLEAQAVARLNHPNIVQVFDIEESDDLTYLVMEYVPGESLAGLLDREALSPDRAARIAAGIAGALYFAHGKGVLHRDVKPANVLISEDRQVKVADFGLAYLLDVDKGYTQTGVLVGSPHYMSPEQCQGLRLDARSDIYALGVVLYRMLAGRLPFEKDSSLAVLMKQVNEVPPDPREFAPDLPEPLVEITRRALKKRPDERFASMREMRNALLVFLGELPEEETPTVRMSDSSPRARAEETTQVSGLTALVTPPKHPSGEVSGRSRELAPPPSARSSSVRPRPAPTSVTVIAPARSSLLPWLLAVLCAAIAGGMGVMLWSKRAEPPVVAPRPEPRPTAAEAGMATTAAPASTGSLSAETPIPVSSPAETPAQPVATAAAVVPSPVPTAVPTEVPTAPPTAVPTVAPTPIPTAPPTAAPTVVRVPTAAPATAAPPTRAPKEDGIVVRIAEGERRKGPKGAAGVCFTESAQSYRFPSDARRPDAEQIRIHYESDPADPVVGSPLVVRALLTNGSGADFFIERFEESDPTGATAPSGLALVKNVAPGQSVELRRFTVDVKSNTDIKRALQVVDGKQGVWTRSFELAPCR